MKTTIERNEKGGYRFNHHDKLPIGEYFTYMGERVKMIGKGMAGMPEMERLDGSSFFAPPHELKRCF